MSAPAAAGAGGGGGGAAGGGGGASGGGGGGAAAAAAAKFGNCDDFIQWWLDTIGKLPLSAMSVNERDVTFMTDGVGVLRIIKVGGRFSKNQMDNILKCGLSSSTTTKDSFLQALAYCDDNFGIYFMENEATTITFGHPALGAEFEQKLADQLADMNKVASEADLKPGNLNKVMYTSGLAAAAARAAAEADEL
jgi:hypothetical protein